MAAIGEWFYGFPSGSTFPSPTNYVIDASNDGLAWLFNAPGGAPSITRAAVRPGALTGSSPTYVLSIQGVDLATGFPDGTIKGGASPCSVEITPAGGVAGVLQQYTFANAYASAAGEMLALCILPKAETTIDGSNNWSFSEGYGAGSVQAWGYPVINRLAATWSYRSGVPTFAVGSSTTWWGSIPYSTADPYTTAGSSPVQVGNVITFPAGMGATVQCSGFWWRMSPSYMDNVVVTLYDSADTILAQTTIDDTPTNGNSAFFAWDNADVSLVCGDSYRLVLTPTADTMRVYYDDVPAADLWDAWPGQQTIQYTQGTTGSWAETTTRRARCGLVLSGITEPAGGGGGGGPVIGSRIIRGLGAL